MNKKSIFLAIASFAAGAFAMYLVKMIFKIN